MQIVSTRLSVPPLRPNAVVRSRLFQKLEQGLERGFVLVSAPPGYGKSTLLSSWLKDQAQGSLWVSLNDGDNDLSRFLLVLVTALRAIEPGLEDMLEDLRSLAPPAAVEAFLTALVNQLAHLQQPFCLVLDDYHVIQNPEVHQAMLFLLEQRPPALRLVIATRADPPLHLARWRARSAMLELRQDDLRFTMGEVAEFFHHTMDLTVSAEDVGRITMRTEGWIAGLQLAALSMQNTEDVSGFIASFTGSHHFILEYLLEEILDQQSSDVNRFLLYTSILNRFTAPLCDALLNEERESYLALHSGETLEALEHANLFIVPLDHERNWYRYHALFGELLQGYLHRRFPSQIQILHTRASVWFEEQGYFADAIHHALEAGEWERVARLISVNVFALLEQSELSLVARQLESLTSSTNRTQPWLCVGQAWLAAYMGQADRIDAFLATAEANLQLVQSSQEQQTLRGHAAAIRAFVTWMSGQRDPAAQAAGEALACLDEDDTMICCLSATLLGLAKDDMGARALALEQALGYARKGSLTHVTMFAYGCWAYMLVQQGRLRQAYAACHEALRLAQSRGTFQPLPTLSYIYCAMSQVLREWNDLEAAVKYGREAVSLASHWGQADALHYAFTILGQAYFSAGEIENAFGVLHNAGQLAQRTSTWFAEITIAQEVEWHLAGGHLDAALQRLSQEKMDIETDTGPFTSRLLDLIPIQVFLAQEQYDRALKETARVALDLERRKEIYFLVRVWVWQAVAQQALGQDEQGLLSLARALSLAAPEGYQRTFLEAGELLIPLLARSRAAGMHAEYAGRLMVALATGQKAQMPANNGRFGLAEPLSAREMEVLRLLAQGSSDKQIAGTLVIAPETVHKHLKNIYGKLDVHSRGEAIARARKLGLM